MSFTSDLLVLRELQQSTPSEFYSYARTGRRGIVIRLVFRLKADGLIPRIFLRDYKGEVITLADQFVSIEETVITTLRREGGLVSLAGLDSIRISKTYEAIYLVKDAEGFESAFVPALPHESHLTDLREVGILMVVGQPKTFTTLALATLNLLPETLLLNEEILEIYPKDKYSRSTQEHAAAFRTELLRLGKQLGLRVVGVKMVWMGDSKWSRIMLSELARTNRLQLITTSRKKRSQISSLIAHLNSFDSSDTFERLFKIYFRLRSKFISLRRFIDVLYWPIFYFQSICRTFELKRVIRKSRIPIENIFHFDAKSGVLNRISLLATTAERFGFENLSPEYFNQADYLTSFQIMTGGRQPGEVADGQFLRKGML